MDDGEDPISILNDTITCPVRKSLGPESENSGRVLL